MSLKRNFKESFGREKIALFPAWLNHGRHFPFLYCRVVDGRWCGLVSCAGTDDCHTATVADCGARVYKMGWRCRLIGPCVVIRNQRTALPTSLDGRGPEHGREGRFLVCRTRS